MNRELTVTLTECTVFIFTLRTLVKQPLEIKLNGPTHWLVCAEFMLWQIEENDVKKEKKIFIMFFTNRKAELYNSLLHTMEGSNLPIFLFLQFNKAMTFTVKMQHTTL